MLIQAASMMLGGIGYTYTGTYSYTGRQEGHSMHTQIRLPISEQRRHTQAFADMMVRDMIQSMHDCHIRNVQATDLRRAGAWCMSAEVSDWAAFYRRQAGERFVNYSGLVARLQGV